MLARLAIVLPFISAVSQATESSADPSKGCRRQENEHPSYDQCNLLQTDIWRGSYPKRRDIRHRQVVAGRKLTSTSSVADYEDSEATRILTGHRENVASSLSHASSYDSTVEAPALYDPTVKASPALYDSSLKAPALQDFSGGRPLEASQDVGRRGLSAIPLAQVQSQAGKQTREMVEAEEESALSAQVQLSTALNRVENGLRNAEAAEVKEASDEHVIQQTLSESAEEVRASQQSADNQLKYTSHMSDFLEDAAQQAEDAHGIEQKLAVQEEKASKFLKKALEEVLAASAAGESQGNRALQEALQQALKAQAEVAAGAAQQEQATSNLNAALNSAARAAMANEALSKLQISPSLQNISKNIEFLQSSSLQHATTQTKVAQFMEGAAQNVVTAEAAADHMTHSWQGVEKAQHRQVQEMAVAQEAMAQENRKTLAEGRHVAQLLQQANKHMEEDHQRAAEELQVAAHEKAEAREMVQAARQKEAWTEQQIQENIRVISKAKEEVARTAQSWGGLQLDPNYGSPQAREFSVAGWQAR